MNTLLPELRRRQTGAMAAACCWLAFPGFARSDPWTVTGAPEGGKITVTRIAGDNPEAGAPVEIYFLIPGLEEKARRALGTIVSVESGHFTVEVDDSTRTGKIGAGDLVAALGPPPGKREPARAEPEAPPAPAPQEMLAPAADLPGEGYLGIVMKDLSEDQAKALGIMPPAIRVTEVVKNSPAERAGLRTGDVIVQFGGEKPQGMASLAQRARQVPPKSVVAVLVLREGREMKLDVEIGVRPKPAIRRVPEDYPNLQSAVNAASWGDVVLLKSGIYRQVVVVRTSGVEIRGENRDATLLRFPDGYPRTGSSLVTVLGATAVNLANLTLEWPPLGVSVPRPQQQVPGDDLIRVNEGGSAVVTNCAFQGRREVNGAYANSGSLKVTGSTFDQCGFAVTAINQGASSQVENCTISGSVFSGILVEGGAHAFVKGCKVASSGESGFLVLGAGTRADVLGNTVAKNGIAGIHYDEGAGGLAEGNNLSENGFAGIFISREGTAPEIRNNQSHFNSKHGIAIASGARATVKANQCFRNVYCGIAAVGAETKPAILDNECNENGHWGIAVDKACYPSAFQGNRAAGNKSGDISRTVTFNR